MSAPLSSAVFTHAVNSRAALVAALRDRDPRVTLLEADVICARDGHAMMGHDPGSASDLAFDDFLAAAQAAGVGVKADLKEATAVQEVLAMLADAPPTAWPLLKVPLADTTEALRPAVIVNADVLQGPGARDGCPFFDGGCSDPLPPSAQEDAAVSFLVGAHALLPAALLSPGWTTAGEGREYTAEHVDAMIRVCTRVCETAAAARNASRADIAGGGSLSGAGGGAAQAGSGSSSSSSSADPPPPPPAFTFPVRGSYVRASWAQLSRLLAALQRPPLAAAAGLTVWSNVPLPPEERAWLRAHLDPRSTLYDIRGDDDDNAGQRAEA